MSDHLVSALGKLEIPLGDYQGHSDFRALPAAAISSFWNFENPPFGLTVFELGALQNARCPTPTQPQRAGKYSSYMSPAL
jgi:hypothetical protein